MYKIKNSNKIKSRKKIISALLVALLLIVFGVFAYTRLTDKEVFGKNEDKDAQTTSTAPSAQEDFTDGDEREPGSSLSENEGSGGITDDNGDIGSVSTSNPLVSDTGEISLYTPDSGSLIASGGKVSGSSTLSTVNYRLIDNVSGLIAEGNLMVIGGKFSGTLNFSTSASEGRLDIYGAKEDGVEFSNIEIPLRFK